MNTIINIELFQELFYNPTGGTGWIASRLKTLRNKSKSDKGTETNGSNTDDNGNEIDENSPEEDLEILRSIVPDARNIDDIHALLARTIDHRKKLFEDKNLNLLVHFPYFFHCPELVGKL